MNPERPRERKASVEVLVDEIKGWMTKVAELRWAIWTWLV